MKFSQICCVITLSFSVVFAKLPLDNWLFNIGDDSSWADIQLDDSSWYTIGVPGSWEKQGFPNYDGVAWYRCRFQLDSTYLTTDTLILYLGQTRDTLSVFLNGSELIDSTITFDSTETVRLSIPNQLRQKDNILAVRVHNRSGDGGLLSGPIYLEKESPLTVKPQAKTTPRRSWYRLPFSNGFVSASYDVQHRRFDDFMPHIYRQFTGNEKSLPVATSARAILFKDRREIDLGEMETASSGYINGTGIIHHKLRNADCELDQYAFSPFTGEDALWVFYTVVTGKSIEQFSLNFEFENIAPTLNVGKWSFRDKNRKWLFVVCRYDKTIDQRNYTQLQKYKNKNPGFSALLNEIDWWKDWQAKTIFPQNITDVERSVYLQSLAILKMAQSRERFPSRGQIVHTFLPNDLASATVSGMAFSIDALLKSGHFEEAQDALQFIMNGNCGSLKHYSWAGEKRGIAQDYAISVNHYYGNGSEATTTGDYGPIIYLSGNGLLLWNLRKYVETTNDFRFLEYYWPKISSEIADVIIGNIDDTGVVRADYGFYNEGAPKHYFFTTACAYKGLVEAVWLARMVNDETRAQEYESAVIDLRKAIQGNFINDDGLVRAHIEEGENELDAAIALGLPWIFTSQDASTKITLANFEKNLALGNGFSRYSQQRPLSSSEWVLGNLAIAKLYHYMADFEKETSLIHWVADQGYHNYHLVPEFYGARQADYTGVIPLCGLGAGVFISTIWGE